MKLPEYTTLQINKIMSDHPEYGFESANDFVLESIRSSFLKYCVK